MVGGVGTGYRIRKERPAGAMAPQSSVLPQRCLSCSGNLSKVSLMLGAAREAGLGRSAADPAGAEPALDRRMNRAMFLQGPGTYTRAGSSRAAAPAPLRLHHKGLRHKGLR